MTCICQGQMSEAQGLLTESVSLMRRKLDDPIVSANPSNNDYEDIGLQSVAIQGESFDQALQPQKSDCSPLGLFDRVFLITKGNAENERLVCAAILYNFAVLIWQVLVGIKVTITLTKVSSCIKCQRRQSADTRQDLPKSPY